MAGIIAVRKALRLLANNYAAGAEWPTENENLYFRNLSDISDVDLIEGVQNWVRKQGRLPNLARLRATIESSPTRRQVIAPLGCPACDHTGQREVARWYQRDGDRVRSEARAAACDCAAGQRLAAGAFISWGRVVDSWQGDPMTAKTENGQPAVFWSTAQKPHLTTAERMTPDEFAEWRARMDAAKEKPNQGPTSWQKLGAPRRG